LKYRDNIAMKLIHIILLSITIAVFYFLPNFFSSEDPILTAQRHLKEGKAFLAEDNPWKARQSFHLAAKFDPNSVEARFLHGTTQLSLKYFQDAINDFTECLMLDPNNGNAYYNRAIGFANMSNFQSAVVDFTMALELNPQDVAAYRDRGVAKQKLGDTSGALNDFRQAVQLNPNYIEAQVSLGYLLVQKESISEGLKHLNLAASLDPQVRENFTTSNTCGLLWSESHEQIIHTPCEQIFP
jgi:tetratricopeptide (TPR) repeat protein